MLSQLSPFLFISSVSQESWWRHCQGHRWLEGPEDHREADHPEQTGSGTYHHDQTHRLIVCNMNWQGWFKGSRYPKRKIQPKSPRNGKTVLQRSVNWSSCRLVLKSKNKMSPYRHQVKTSWWLILIFGWTVPLLAASCEYKHSAWWTHDDDLAFLCFRSRSFPLRLLWSSRLWRSLLVTGRRSRTVSIVWKWSL